MSEKKSTLGYQPSDDYDAPLKAREIIAGLIGASVIGIALLLFGLFLGKVIQML